MARQLRRAALVAALVVALDRATKLWVIEGLGLPQRLHHPGLGSVAELHHGLERGHQLRPLRLRRGRALGAGRRWRWRSSRRSPSGCGGPRGWGPAAGVGLIVGGALGNVWDRLQYGAVADFINMSCCGIRNPFAFNVADAAIFAGAAVLILLPRR